MKKFSPVARGSVVRCLLDDKHVFLATNSSTWVTIIDGVRHRFYGALMLDTHIMIHYMYLCGVKRQHSLLPVVAIEPATSTVARAHASRIGCLTSGMGPRPARVPPGPSGSRTAHPSYDMVPRVYGSGRGSPTLLGVTPTYIRSPPHHPGCKSLLQFSLSSHTRVRTAFHACCFHVKRHSRNHRTAVACRRASPGHLRLTQCATILLYTCEDV